MADGSTVQEIPQLKRGVRDVSFSADGSVIGITEDFSGHAFYYRVGEATPFQSLKPTGYSTPKLPMHRLLKDGKRVLGFGHMARSLSIWSLETGELLQPIKARSMYAAASTADDTRVAASTWSRLDYESISIHDLESGKQVDELAGYEKPVYDLCFSSDARQLAAALKGGTIVVWNLSERCRGVAR
jgi:WD40 repeat protein